MEKDWIFSLFLGEKLLWQKYRLNKCDRLKLICSIMKCCDNAYKDQMEETLQMTAMQI